MNTKEVLTLQFGNFSNHVGTHFWNLQYDSLRSDNINNSHGNNKLFRETLDRDQPLIPRMICFDEKRKLNALKLDGTFESKKEDKNDGYDFSVNDLDEDDYIAFKQTEIEKNEYLLHHHSNKNQKKSKKLDFDLDDKITSWSDYMSYKVNENSLQMLKNRFEDDSKFSYYGLGSYAYKQIKDDVEDKLHFWIEECNSLDGVLMFTDLHDGFCGVSSELLKELKDDYGSKSFLSYINYLQPSEESNDPYHWLNIALSFQSLYHNSSMFVLQSMKTTLGNDKHDDVAIDHISYKADLPYHSSAILASAINSSTLPWRQTNSSEIFGICQPLTQGRWKLVGSSIGFPFAKDSDDVPLTLRMLSDKKMYQSFLTNLFPLCGGKFNPLTQSVVMQDNYGLVVPEFDRKILQSIGLNCDMFFGKTQKFLDFYLEKLFPTDKTISSAYYTKETTNFISPVSSMFKTKDITNTAVMSSLFTSPAFYSVLSNIISHVQRMNVNKLHIAKEFGLDEDLFAELIEDLIALSENYHLDDKYKEASY